MNKLSAGILLSSQGISFMMAGEEMGRSKDGNDNSYRSPVSLNMIDWSLLSTNADLVSYYRGLIDIRKAFSPFTEGTNAYADNYTLHTVKRQVENPKATSSEDEFTDVSNCVAFTVDNGTFNFNVGDGTNAYNRAIEADSGLDNAEIEVTVDRKAQKLILAVNGTAKEFDMDGFGKDLTFDALAFTIGAGAGNNLGNHISMKLAKFEVYR